MTDKTPRTRAEAYALTLRHAFTFTVPQHVAQMIKRSAKSQTYLFPDGSRMQILPGWAKVSREGEGRHYIRLPIAVNKKTGF